MNANLSSKIKVKEINLASRYEFIDAQTDERINESLENINLSASYTGFENFSVGATRRFDLSESAVASSTSSFEINFSAGFWDYQVSQTFDRREPEKHCVGIYDDDCTRVRISLQNNSKAGSFDNSIQSLVVLVQLKPLKFFCSGILETNYIKKIGHHIFRLCHLDLTLWYNLGSKLKVENANQGL